MEEITIAINHSVGLHARPAAEFVKLASSFPCELKISNVSASSDPVNAKSILAILSLGVSQGDVVMIRALGEGATEAVRSLENLIRSNFGE